MSGSPTQKGEYECAFTESALERYTDNILACQIPFPHFWGKKLRNRNSVHQAVLPAHANYRGRPGDEAKQERPKAMLTRITLMLAYQREQVFVICIPLMS